jgi:cytochrome c oxidase cbb3-type subunit III
MRPGGVIPLTLLLLAGCDLPGKPKPSDRPVPAENVVDFDLLYSRNCAGCHGADGKLGPAPPLNDPLFLALVPDKELLRVIREGRSGTPMTAFAKENAGPLTSKQVKVLAQGIKPRWLPVKEPKENPPSYLIAAENGDKKAGLAVFRRACATCHGKDGEGGKSAGALHDSSFLAVISDQALRRLAITGRPDLGMPDYATRDDPGYKPLTSQDITNLVALLAYWRVGGVVNDK